ncbi:branched-chain amino acid ABC transporter permease [Rhodococcus koreensis]|uniref:Amino acid/amide ABC transporter membrane protein 1, HAAT family n=1 Tax=Rhodococcus koreensis TaxID=99653 RepID=A0A1H4L0N9_9NOCA|nr:branched-chain amino acid ABC transporter permease [Rhodococcus koreensis]SEB63958.1 amino acid/amide ABC transporter membrane protein 1, HAAT family [Rhodococcus koreensis]
MDTLISAISSGLSQGSIAVVAAVGLVVIIKATGIINFAHGDVLTMGAYVAMVLISVHSLPIWLAYLLAIVAGGALGLATERLVYRPIRNRSMLSIMVILFAVGLLVRESLILWRGSGTHPLESFVGTGVLRIGEAAVPYQSILIVVVMLVVVTALVLIFEKTQLGRQFRALAADRETAFLVGIRAGWLSSLAFIVAGMLAALGGVLLAPLLSVSPTLGFGVLLTAFAATVLGGTDRLVGVTVAGLGLGLIQAFATTYISSAYSSVYPFVVFILVLAVRPEGLFQSKVKVRY